MPQNDRLELPYVVKKNTHFRALRAHGAREQKMPSHELFFMTRRFQRAIARPIPCKGHQTVHNILFIII